VNADLTPERIQVVVQGMIVFILSVALHEFGHAWACDRLGDSLPRRQGRVTLNPMAHADPIGTLLLPALFLISTGGLGFAWGKPVMHTTFDRKKRLVIAFAGPAMNVVLATVVALSHVVLVKAGVLEWGDKLSGALLMACGLNWMLFFFNLIPAAPLDGGSVARGLIPRSWVPGYDQYAQYAPFVVLAFMMIPQFGAIVRKPTLFMVVHSYELLFRMFHVVSPGIT
jgi:Zn-dependent protease